MRFEPVIESHWGRLWTDVSVALLQFLHRQQGGPSVTNNYQVEFLVLHFGANVQKKGVGPGAIGLAHWGEVSVEGAQQPFRMAGVVHGSAFPPKEMRDLWRGEDIRVQVDPSLELPPFGRMVLG